MQTSYEFTRRKIRQQRKAKVRRAALVLVSVSVGMALNATFGLAPSSGSGAILLLESFRAALLPWLCGVAAYLATS